MTEITNPINPVRHLSVFSPSKFGDRRVDVIGCGATGSSVIVSLAKLGINNIHVWDFDEVEEHNLANQVFGPSHVGKPKAEAIADVVHYLTGAKITVHNEAVEAGMKNLGEIVFLLTDTMKSRKAIGKECVYMNMKTKLLIETRMGAEFGEIYTVAPMNTREFNDWYNTLFDDAEAEVSACGGQTTIGSTASIIANMAVWQMLNWIRFDKIEDNFLSLSIRPLFTMNSKFGDVAKAA